MPNFDTGHYFLTVLAPIKSGMITNLCQGAFEYPAHGSAIPNDGNNWH